MRSKHDYEDIARIMMHQEETATVTTTVIVNVTIIFDLTGGEFSGSSPCSD